MNSGRRGRTVHDRHRAGYGRNAVSGNAVPVLIGLANNLMRHPIELIQGLARVLADLSEAFTLILISKDGGARY